MEELLTLPSMKKTDWSALLLRIVSQKQPDLRTQLQNALDWATEALQMELGIISSIEHDIFTVQYFSPAKTDLTIGTEFSLSNTYCSIALNHETVFTVEHMRKSTYASHACYQMFELESYIGKPYLVENSLYGTVNFSSKEPKNEPFTEEEINFVNLLSEWISSQIYRKKIEDKLKEEHALYKLISTNSAEMICMHKPDGTYTYVSPSVKQLLGYEPEELIGTSPYELFHSEDIENIANTTHKDARNGKVSTTMTYRIRKKDGTYIWFDSAIQPVVNASGDVIQLQTTSRDVTEVKRLQLMFSEAQEMANVGGWEYDLGSGKLYWTDEVYRIHEIEVGTEVYVEDGMSYYPESAREELQTAIDQSIAAGDSWDLTLPFITAKGNRIWVRAIGKAEYDNGNPAKLRGTFQNVTELKSYEDEVKAKIKQVTELKHTREKLYAILAHDLRNAVFGISGLLKFLLEDIEDNQLDIEAVLEKLKIVEMSSSQTYKLLDNMLTWVKIQSGNLDLEPHHFEVATDIDATLELLLPAIKQKKLHIKRSYTTDSNIYGEPKLINTVLRNLLNNAIKFSNIGGEIDIQIKEQSLGMIAISVIDHGVGMSENALQNIFNPNVRPKQSGTLNEKGSGLGLLLSKELAHLSGGDISATSKRGEGATFTFVLPRVLTAH